MKRNNIIIISLFSIYDSVFNIILDTESVLNQTIYFLLIVLVIISSMSEDKKVSGIQWEFITWANKCYWVSMAMMYVVAFILFQKFDDWIRFNKSKIFTYSFLMLWLCSFLISWFLWKDRKHKKIY